MVTRDAHDDSVPTHASEGVSREDADALLIAVSRGNRSAMLALYDHFGASLLAIAMRITGSRSEAEDVIQDVFTRAWREAQSFDRTRGTSAAWMVTLTRNRAIDHVRARKRRVTHEDDQMREEPVVLEAPASPERSVSEAQRAAAVRLALDTLRPEQRQVLELAYFGGLSHSEIAEKLQQPLGTVKTRIAQAMKRLRDELDHFSVDAASVTE
jgi:RNA polymerase sigma-70 factor (ECF subfamily)